MSLRAQLEALLFFKGESVKISWLSKTLKRNVHEIKEGIEALKESLKNRGIVLIHKDDSVALRTAPQYSDILIEIRKEELSRDIGKAGLETLSIILYRGPIARAEIDYIRGVNSSFIIRNLLIRGLVEKISNPKDTRAFLYRPSFELLSFLGISKISELPEYERVKEEVADFEKAQQENEEQNKEYGEY